MDYRNPIYTKNGLIDCEINHPIHGWIPFTCDPNDTGAKFDTATLFAEMQPHAAPYAPPPPHPQNNLLWKFARNAIGFWPKATGRSFPMCRRRSDPHGPLTAKHCGTSRSNRASPTT